MTCLILELEAHCFAALVNLLGGTTGKERIVWN
jgi:hypothetical protein